MFSDDSVVKLEMNYRNLGNKDVEIKQHCPE